MGRKKTTLTTEVVVVTPKMAERWLEESADTNYRKESETYVSILAEQMKNGQWEDNGESVKFDPDGNVVDGQHRLAAIAKGRKHYDLVIVRGVKSSREVDRGLKRTLAQHVSSLGHPHSTACAAAIRCYACHSLGNLWIVSNTVRRMGIAQHLRTLELHPEIPEWVKLVYGAHRETGASRGMLAVAFMLMDAADQKLALEYISALSGEVDSELVKGHISFHIRKRVLKEARSTALKTSSRLRLAWIIRGWNGLRRGVHISKLQTFNRDGSLPLIE